MNEILAIVSKIRKEDVEVFIHHDVSLLGAIKQTTPPFMLMLAKNCINKNDVRNFRAETALDYFRHSRPDLYALFQDRSNGNYLWFYKNMEDIRSYLLS
jgi:hypothetical protein